MFNSHCSLFLCFDKQYTYAETPLHFQLSTSNRKSLDIVNDLYKSMFAMYEIRKYDEFFVENFTNKVNSNFSRIKKKLNSISNARITVNNINKIKNQLANLNKELRNKNLSNDLWYKKVALCEGLKVELKTLLMKMKCNKLQFLKSILIKRNHLRNRIREKKSKWTLRKKYSDAKRMQLINIIDHWIEDMQNEVTKDKETENLRKNADIVLADVRAKRSDVRRFLIILTELENMRKLKVRIARVRGESIAIESDEVFKNIIVKLLQQWTTLDREYLFEEKGLNLMIKTDERKISNHSQSIWESWEMSLFKNKTCSNALFKEHLKNLLTSRMIWDKQINLIEGSEIPVGWIMPCKPSSHFWIKYLA